VVQASLPLRYPNEFHRGFLRVRPRFSVVPCVCHLLKAFRRFGSAAAPYLVPVYVEEFDGRGGSERIRGDELNVFRQFRRADVGAISGEAENLQAGFERLAAGAPPAPEPIAGVATAEGRHQRTVA
jgi:hypothetical protein